MRRLVYLCACGLLGLLLACGGGATLSSPMERQQAPLSSPMERQSAPLSSPMERQQAPLSSPMEPQPAPLIPLEH